jgi:hypothetical protein
VPGPMLVVRDRHRESDLEPLRHGPAELQTKRVACPRNQNSEGRSHRRAARFGIVPFLGCRRVVWVAGVFSTPILTSNPSLGRYFCHRELVVAGAEKELRVQECGKDCVPCLGIETEQALGLRRGELETGHLEVFRADSVQQFCR